MRSRLGRVDQKYGQCISVTMPNELRRRDATRVAICMGLRRTTHRGREDKRHIILGPVAGYKEERDIYFCDAGAMRARI